MLDLEHCYGIKKLKADLDFGKTNAIAIYAPNGAMKSSLAKTFQDIADGKDSGDRIFKDRINKRMVTDEKGNALPPESVMVVLPYEEAFGHSEKTSTLLVNSKLRAEYEKLNLGFEDARQRLLAALRVGLENHGWAFLRSMMPPMATRIMACETSMRCS
ncbi:hypothetical protein LHFGNBLO_006484 (plasmid) [Mesorhizobium sp. AR10]|uniref:hypothetical protein n=1 Tax=Mesorhizobium sp. AR10 TaxID=2865839 RepID=UPI00215F2340|nr:hypothetical protein [Mesorhizobium sp. AR10]UVK35644.1 hypothetical protein LHFGNBLO_006484 [Mesorhizobium sp. AR10]